MCPSPVWVVLPIPQTLWEQSACTLSPAWESLYVFKPSPCKPGPRTASETWCRLCVFPTLRGIQSPQWFGEMKNTTGCKKLRAFLLWYFLSKLTFIFGIAYPEKAVTAGSQGVYSFGFYDIDANFSQEVVLASFHTVLGLSFSHGLTTTWLWARLTDGCPVVPHCGFNWFSFSCLLVVHLPLFWNACLNFKSFFTYCIYSL